MRQQGMTMDEHLRTALDFLEHSTAEFDAGDVLQGSEKLWGAASHAAIAVAQLRGWSHGSHREMTNAVERLASEQNHRTVKLGFAVAAKSHRNFYNNIMPDFEVVSDRPEVALFVRRLLNIATPTGG